ncbi:MAG TPA: FHA domain-containing protein [Thermoanaerobaculia bacterium]|nr:FHA domain-containing protein [Thermoanaerobaculia bacterium]
MPFLIQRERRPTTPGTQAGPARPAGQGQPAAPAPQPLRRTQASRQMMINRVPGGVLRIGRGTNAELRLEGAAVALEHAVIRADAGGFQLLDRGSVTGTYLNGQRVKEAQLANGDTIRVGNFQLTVLLGSPETAAVAGLLGLTVREVAEAAPPESPGEETPRARAPAPPGADYLSALSLRRWFLGKALLALVVTLATGIVLVALPLRGKLTAFQPGPVAAAHAGLACGACHAPWRGPTPAQCADCHGKQQRIILVHQPRQAFNPPCAGCHPEHRGETAVLRADDQSCVSCHGDLQVADGGEPRFARHVHGFASDHPEFAVTLAGGVRLPLAEAVAHRAGLALLRFNHRQHLRPGLPAPAGRRVQLSCASCHLVGEGAGTGIVPFSYQQSCTTSGCHPLTFDERRPDQVAPHADPQRVREFLLSAYAERRAPRESVGALYRRLVRTPQAAAGVADFGAGAQRAMVGAERYLYRTACKECHDIDFAATPLPRVRWGANPARHLPYSHFSHLDHRQTACADCHGGAARSTGAADVLLPGITVCRRCHGGAAEAGAARASSPAVRPARAECRSCHEYHPRRPPGWVAQAS